MRAVALGVLVLMLGGCRGSTVATTPEGAYRAFSLAVAKGDVKRAFAALSPETQKRVAARSKAIAEASKGAVRDEPEMLLFQLPNRAKSGPATQLSRVRADENSAVLAVASSEGTWEVKLVKDSGQWFVELSDALEDASP